VRAAAGLVVVSVKSHQQVMAGDRQPVQQRTDDEQ
jgi:hypothetical protein